MNKKILVIDDNYKHRVLFKDILTYHGYDVIEAGNGEEGINKAKEHRPDLIIMDMQMPGMDGFTTTGILKNDPDTKDIKIIGVTSFAMVGDREKVIGAGADEYISKPVNTRELPKIVERMLSGI